VQTIKNTATFKQRLKTFLFRKFYRLLNPILTTYFVQLFSSAVSRFYQIITTIITDIIKAVQYDTQNHKNKAL